MTTSKDFINTTKRKERSAPLLKPGIIKKISSLLATLLIVSILVPALAFAASKFEGVTYGSDGTVSGIVYLDTYTEGMPVYISVYGPDGKFIMNLADTATYVTYENGIGWKYSFKGVTSATYNTYNPVVFAVYNGTERLAVSDVTYKSPVVSPPGGGGIFFPPTSGEVNIGADGKANADQLAALLEKNENARLKFTGDFVLLPAWVLSKGKLLTVENDFGTYSLPLTKLDAEALAKKVGVELKDLYIRVSIAKVSEATLADVTKAAYAEQATVISNVIDFKVQTEATGKTALDVDFGKTYVKRTVKLDSAFGKINTLASTGVLYDAAGKSILFVPSSFAALGDKSEVAIWRVGNSIYAAVETKKSFTDISTHWAKVDIQNLANKLVVEGYNNRFLPQNDITRAEFTAIVVRALGLTTSGAKSAGFKDVASTMWYADVINAAAQAGLVKGNGDGTFKPNDKISREEVAALVVRALAYTGKDVNVSAADKATALRPYTDASKVSAWAKDEVASAIKLGLVKGFTPTTIKGQLNATRAEAVTLIKRLLDTTGFTN